MATRLIFTLGTGDYQVARYGLDGATVETPFAAIATRDLYDRRAATQGEAPIQAAYVLVTPESRAKNLPALRRSWGASMELYEVDITHQGDLDQLWHMFDAVAGIVQDGDRLVLDITHGFRSMPIIALLVVAYLGAARVDARLAMLTYGAFEATAEGVTPLYDLTPMASLLDWTAAVHHFDRGGDAQTLAALIRRLNSEVQKRPDVQKDGRPQALSSLARQLERLAIDLQTFRYEDAVSSATSLKNLLGRTLENAPDRQAVRPLATLLPRIEEALAPFEAHSAGSPLVDLTRHRQVMEWLLARGLYLPYLAMLSEALVGMAASSLGLYDMAGGDNERIRKAHHFASTVLSGACKDLSGHEAPPMHWRAEESDEFGMQLASLDPLALRRQLLSTDAGRKLATLAEQVRPIRNSLMHAGMSNDPAPQDGPGMQKAILAFHSDFKALPAFALPV